MNIFYLIFSMMLVFMTGSFCVISFLIGANERNKKINLNPITAIKEHKEEKRQEEERDLELRQKKVMWENIENYG